MAKKSSILMVFAIVVTTIAESIDLSLLTVAQKSSCIDARYNHRHEPGSKSGDCSSLVIDAVLLEEELIEQNYIREIASWSSGKANASTIAKEEKRVIAFGLYGNKTKYVHGCFANIKLANIYYPGWVCRFYCADVDVKVLDLLAAEGAEVVAVSGSGQAMSRFLVANDSTVDRFIVRDVDSRLNSRERFAVQEWINSGLPLHSMRDHTNQWYEYNAGMWGGTKGSVPWLMRSISNMTENEMASSMADTTILGSMWQFYQNDTLAHDSYSCLKYIKQGHIHLRAFPTRRPLNYLHVGQVWNDNEKPRMNDVDRFMRGIPTPEPCRRHVEWIYG